MGNTSLQLLLEVNFKSGCRFEHNYTCKGTKEINCSLPLVG